MAAKTSEKTLETIAKKASEDKMHAALLLAFAQAAYSVVRRDCTPSPLYRFSFDKDNVNMEMDELEGHSRVPRKNSLDISDLDIILMSDLREIPILFEGTTGIGKTFVSQRYLSTILTQDNYFSHRLSANAFVNNLFQHFQEGKMVNGMPVIEARTDRINTTAAGIIDEINRGDPNETLQLFDNEMHLGGRIYKLGIPIPEIKNGTYQDSGRKKKMALISAQNPASTEDAQFTGTMQLDAAVDNRLLKVDMSNAAQSAGSTLWLNDGKGKRHELFMKLFSENVSRNLGLETKIEEGEWLPTYAWITDSKKTDKPILYSSLELADIMTGIFGGNIINYFNDYEKKIIEDWNTQLGAGVVIKANLTETDKVKKINQVVESFKVPIIFRDVVQIKKIADILSTLKNVKDALRSDNPVDTYTSARKYVTVREVAEAVALVARNKQKSNSESPVPAINEILNQYCKLCEEYGKDSKKVVSDFDIYNPQVGIKNIAVVKSIRDCGGSVDSLVESLNDEAKKLSSKVSASEEVRNIIIARSVSDLLTLSGFLKQYKSELEQYTEKPGEVPALEKYKKNPSNLLDTIAAFYCQKQKEDALVLPDIYQHRIQRTLGIENTC